MFQNYVKTAFRNLVRHGRHTCLNLIGLGVALGACIIVFLVIQYENSYDKHLKGFRDVYQVVLRDADADGEHFESGVPFPTIKYLRKDFAGYTFAELMQNYNTQVTARSSDGNDLKEKKFIETTGLFYGEPELAKIFELDFISGDADALAHVNNALLSVSMAEKYFGGADEALGKRIRFNNENHDFQIAGVFRDVPQNSDFPFHILASYAGFVAYNNENTQWPLEDWGANTSNHQVYVKLPAQGHPDEFNKQIAGIEKKYNTGSREVSRTYFLQPLQNIHFDERFSNNGDHITSKTSLYTLSFIGLLIILMACINFVNLSTALAVNRSREVGIRKVMGSNRSQVRWQVYAETALMVGASVALALILSAMVLPAIKNFMVVQHNLSLFNTGSVLFLIIITAVTIFISGFYPAFVMGRFRPVEAIKNKINTSQIASISLRRILVVLQFAFSQIFIIATIIAVSQMRFIQHADLGFKKESILLIPMNTDSMSLARHEAFRNELRARPDVKQLSFSFDAPSSENSWSTNFAFDAMEDRNFDARLKFADAEYPSVYGLELVAGRYYGTSDTTREYVVNETFLKKNGFKNPREAVGKMLRLGGGRPRPVVGVVKDFKVASLREGVPPIVLAPRKIYYGTAGILLSSNNLSRSRDEIKKVWDRLFPEYVYNPVFFDENIRNFYQQEERLSRMYKAYALLAILISCLGLYGLISFMAIRKTKEVGIRKVLGASTGNILYLFSKEFTVLIFIAFMLAAPAAWYLMHQWLNDFVFRIKPGPAVFIGAMALSILIAWLTVGYKALQASLANPIKSLRSE